ncbi:thiol reductase thioredoxin [Thioalkalivibrio denitrificans]|uniref:Thioredoxin n=1 Tax=Thioalkalivibrio denitrificans TaxID=108003 RepID=A0A1V3N7R9_9GAMM|nr:thioredoxin TrxC [Thioalkalivibrio denitrificans]OOG21041.1 thiol reductase thioredoxin [Thioalkalivibrio denitrificans]
MSDAPHVVCARCGGVNRVPASRSAAEARCGRCHEPLFDGQPAELDTAGLERQITRSHLPVLVDFWAPWCGPCKVMAPAYAQAARELEPRIRLVKLDTQAHPEPAARYGIRGIPTMILFRNGRETARTSGAMDARSIVAWVRGAVRD